MKRDFSPIRLKAVEMGIQGVAVASVLNRGETIATEADSGNPEHTKILGECGFVGGAFEEYDGFKMAFAFSGALSEEDLEVARFGIKKMKESLISA